MSLGLELKLEGGFTPDQLAYIEQYANGLLISWTQEHIGNILSQDIGDGFHPKEGLFENENKEWEAHEAVVWSLEKWLHDLTEKVGFKPGDPVPVQGDKYPTLPTE
jgi:hypothetical protein